MIDTKKLIASPSYSFLRENDDLKNIILLTLSGSHAYGTNHDGSDVDLRGALVEQPKYLYGLHSFEQFENLQTDTVIYGLRKFFSLCVNANPNVLELLGTRDECIVKITPAGTLLRENVQLFLTQSVIHSFGNYAAMQLRRLRNALYHDVLSPREQEAYLATTLNKQLARFNRTYTKMDDNALRIYCADSDAQLLLDVQLSGYPLRDFVGIYGEMNNILKTFGKLNHRNRKKDEPHLYKHAMHLIRLLITGEDILRGNGIQTFRAKEHRLLMDIRNGKYSFPQIFELAKEYQACFDDAAEQTQLPIAPDMKKIEALMLQIYEIEGMHAH